MDTKIHFKKIPRTINFTSSNQEGQISPLFIKQLEDVRKMVLVISEQS